MSAIKTDAAIAAANTYNVISGIPLVGPFLAPAAAAAAYAAVVAYESFDVGGIIPGSGAVPIMGHGGERVLTQTQTNTFDKIANNSSTTNNPQIHNHMHYNGQVSMYDRTGGRSMLRAHADDLLDIVQQGFRDGKLKG
jgi:hypothetical protein